MSIMEDGVLEGVLPELIALRHNIHSRPDLSGQVRIILNPEFLIQLVVPFHNYVST